MSGDKKYCPQCSQELESDWLFCPSCRFDLSQMKIAEVDAEIEAEQSKPREVGIAEAESVEEEAENDGAVVSEDKEFEVRPVVPPIPHVEEKADENPVSEVEAVREDSIVEPEGETIPDDMKPEGEKFEAVPEAMPPIPPAGSAIPATVMPAAMPNMPEPPLPRGEESAAGNKKGGGYAGWLTALVLGCVACFAIGLLFGIGIQKSNDDSLIKDARERIEQLEQQLRETGDPLPEIYNIQELQEYLDSTEGKQDPSKPQNEENVDELLEELLGIDGHSRDDKKQDATDHGMFGIKISDTDKGVEIAEVSKGSGSEKAGLKEGDVIVKIEGREVKYAKQVVEFAESTNPGDVVKVETSDGRVHEVIME